MIERRPIRCVACGGMVSARLTNGAEIYPRREDLADIPFWKCDGCGNYVGCHHKTSNPTQPLGFIPTPELRNARKHIHALLDKQWGDNRERKEVYAKISKELGVGKFHTAELTNVEDARTVYRIVQRIARERNRNPM